MKTLFLTMIMMQHILSLRRSVGLMILFVSIQRWWSFAGTTVRVYKVPKVSWTLGRRILKRDVGLPAANFSRSSKKCKFKLWMNLEQSWWALQLINFCNIYLKKSVKKIGILYWHPISDFWFSDRFFNWVSTKTWPDPEKWMSFLDSAWPN